MSRGARPPRSVRGCEREQEAGAPRSGDATVRESLAAAGKDRVRVSGSSTGRYEVRQMNAGGDRRIAASRRQHGISDLRDLSEAAA
jgi:hypothetical protein